MQSKQSRPKSIIDNTYKLGFHDEFKYSFISKKGLSQETVKEISYIKGEPSWMTDFRLKSYEAFKNKEMPSWIADKKVIDDIGLLNEKYFMYYEDIDYSMKVRSKGLKAYYYPQAFIWHKNASSSGRPGSPLHVYYQTRNRLYFGIKYAPFRTKKSLLLESAKFLFQGGIRLKATLDCLLNRMGQQSYEN